MFQTNLYITAIYLPAITYFLSERAPSQMLRRAWIDYSNIIDKNNQKAISGKYQKLTLLDTLQLF